jgi:protein N-terminal glutamine amidohydrolase
VLRPMKVEGINPQYAPYYCEENIWFLSQEPHLANAVREVVIISNERRMCPLWEQRAGGTGNVVFWDYHVILLCRWTKWYVWDLDTLLGAPVDLAHYVQRTFFRDQTLEKQFELRVRVIPADEYVATFSSDRSHMRNFDGQWLAPPPPWPMILKPDGTDLMEVIDMKKRTPGVVMSIRDFACEFSALKLPS